MIEHRHRSGTGPFQVSQLREEDRYKLSDGHPIYALQYLKLNRVLNSVRRSLDAGQRPESRV